MTTARKGDQEPRLLFENLKRVADTLVRTFGHHCEAVVHDLSDLEHSLIHIAGKVTGRKIGGPITDLVVKALRQEGDGVNDIANYRTLTQSGRILKSSTTFIRDSAGKVIGAFCVNFDITDYLNATSLIDNLIATEDLAAHGRTETFALSVDETIGSLIDEAIAKMGKQPATMSREERIQLVGHLEKMGAFAIKGAVDTVAQHLGVSIFTVYNYLKQVRNGKQLM